MNYQPRQKQQETEAPAFVGRFANYRREGLAYIQSQKLMGLDPCRAIKPDMPEWRSWETYFRKNFGRLPPEMKFVTDGRLSSITVPSQWAEEFERFCPTFGKGR